MKTVLLFLALFCTSGIAMAQTPSLALQRAQAQIAEALKHEKLQEQWVKQQGKTRERITADLTFHVYVMPDGTVDRVEFTETNNVSEQLTDQTAAVVSGLHFPELAGEGMTYTVAWSYEPGRVDTRRMIWGGLIGIGAIIVGNLVIRAAS